MTVVAACSLFIVDDPEEIRKLGSPMGKPFLRLVLPEGQVVNMTINLGEMIGGAATGARMRFEDMKKAKH